MGQSRPLKQESEVAGVQELQNGRTDRACAHNSTAYRLESKLSANSPEELLVFPAQRAKRHRHNIDSFHQPHAGERSMMQRVFQTSRTHLSVRLHHRYMRVGTRKKRMCTEGRKGREDRSRIGFASRSLGTSFFCERDLLASTTESRNAARTEPRATGLPPELLPALLK
jgi:hypothetical protein